ncbi:DUF808 domain-containing protein [Halomonas shantousis]
MAGASLLTLIDDIATILDDISVMSKVAAKKTAGVLGDDLALNAQQVTGVRADRELPVVWSVAKGSLRNKLILVPAALLISAFAPWLVTPLLMLGGAFLCYEGFEKLAHRFLHDRHEEAEARERHRQRLADTQSDIRALEKDKIKGAVRTDFILSAEIVAITLGTVAGASLTQQVVVVAGIALTMTVGVYGLVAGIVKLDDLGGYLHDKGTSVARPVGDTILRAAPYLMKGLSIVGTVAMFMVGGGILTHGIPFLHHSVEGVARAAETLPGIGIIAGSLSAMLLNIVLGILAGALVLAVVKGFTRLRRKFGAAR